MLEALLLAFTQIFSGATPLYLMGGVLLGLVVGILPGFGGSVGLALLLPFVYGMDPTNGLALMIGVTSVVATSDTFPAVLIGVPGSVSSQATVQDGFPMAKRGEASRALAAGFTASLIGGLFGAVILTFMIQLARPIVLSFGTGEMLMLGVFGLSMVGVLAGSSILKGVIATLLGLVIGMIGLTPASNEYRMEFEVLYLSNGIPIMVVAISIFAIPEIVSLLRSSRAISDRAVLGRGWLTGMRDTIRHRWLVLRCSALGTLIGMLPGLGGSVVDWIAYAHAVQSSKDKSQFGKGDVRGVLAPESSNNAKEGGALVPTLIFGIPGSAATAILLGGMILLGVEPGIQMVSTNVEVIYTIIWSLALANIVGALLCVALAQPISRLTTIDFRLIAPFLIVLVMFAAYQSSRSWGDLVVAGLMGVLAVYMRRFGYPRPALMIGFVLAPGLETNFYQTVSFYGWDVFTRPLFLGLLAISLASAYGGYRMLRAQYASGDMPRFARTSGQLVMVALMALAPLFALWATADMHWRGNLFAQVVAVPMFVLCAVLAWRVWRGREGSPDLYDADHEVGRPFVGAPAWRQILWLVLLLGVAAIVGFWLAVGLFVFGFLVLRSDVESARAAMGAGAALLVLATLSYALRLDFPEGLIQETWRLPFPLS